jgi:uncharacterized protein
MSDEFPINENADRSRLEISLGEDMAVLEYKVDGGRMLFTHTETPPAFRGRGIAEKLVLEGFRLARDRKLQIVPVCSYVAAVLRRHPEFAPYA